MNPVSHNLPTVQVFMATYNGETYVAQQIESILNQQGVNVSLLISDDGSHDRTIEICKEIAATHANVQFEKNESNKGPAKNFMDMLYRSHYEGTDYFAFSDQDDYWLPNKLEVAINLIKEYPEKIPVLYYSDVCNTDENLEGEHYDYGIFKCKAKSLDSIFAGNTASGCTEVFNRPLFEIITSFEPSEYPILHDWWIHEIALACGETIPDLDRSFIRRRITGKNEIGQSEYGKFNAKRTRRLFFWYLEKPDHGPTKAADLLLQGYSKYMSSQAIASSMKFSNFRHSQLARLKGFFDKSYIQPTFFENLIMHAKILLNRF